jgi:hypothetical protein
MKIIITEQQNEKLNKKIRLVVEKLGFKQSLEMFGKDIIKQAFIGDPESFLNQFNGLKLIEQYNDGHSDINYVDENNFIIFYYKVNNDRHRSIYVDYDIWNFFENIMGFSESKSEEIIKNWLKDVYGLVDKPIGIMLSKIKIS